MKTALIITVLFVLGCSQQVPVERTANESHPVENSEPQTADASPDVAKPESNEGNDGTPTEQADSQPIKPLTSEQQNKLLDRRLGGGMGNSFRQFSNRFLVFSRLEIGTGIGLMTSDRTVADLPLQSPFPASYMPTLREFLDAIAIQTFSEWKYDPSSQYFQSDVELDSPIEDFAIFEFIKRESDRVKPFAVTLADDWKTKDHGNWVMHIPPSFPVGMDVYEMGSYSSDENANEDEFANKIRSAVALEWAQRVNQNAKPADLVPAKVGDFDALFYESMIPSQLGREIKWRQWVLMADNKCYFIVSTILPQLEDDIFPDVEKMVASFRINKERSPPPE